MQKYALHAKSVNEIKKTGSPLARIGAGMSSLISAWAKSNDINPNIISINDDMTLDAYGDININNRGLNTLFILDMFSFRIVYGDFYCSTNNLTTLKGGPSKVFGDFLCGHNKLKSLEYAPTLVGNGFYVSNNELTSLYGAPKTVGGDFSCSYNKLTSLVGAPVGINGNFRCNNNKLRSLQGAPKTVTNNFICYENSVKFDESDVRSVCKVGGKIITKTYVD